MYAGFVVLAFVAAASASAIMPLPGAAQLSQDQQRLYEEYIIKKFNELIAPLKEIDPIKKDFAEFDIYVLSGTVENALVSGFSDQVISHLILSISILHPGIEVTYEMPSGTEASVGHYTFEGLVPGDGKAHLKTRSLKLELVARYNVLKPSESKFRFAFHLEAEFHLTGLFHDEKLSEKISAYINEFLASLNVEF